MKKSVIAYLVSKGPISPDRRSYVHGGGRDSYNLWKVYGLQDNLTGETVKIDYELATVNIEEDIWETRFTWRNKPVVHDYEEWLTLVKKYPYL